VLYQAALRNQLVHAVEHASFLSVALPFWWLVLDRRGLRQIGFGPAVLLVFLNGVQSGALGALLTFAPSPLYPIHSAGVAAWNTTLVQDQQLAGLLMWIPAGTIFIVVASWLFLRWLGSMEGDDVKEVITSVG
jgi:cytochrome c oxidase assembly factor CtaG